jgi:hypothetical protein
MPDLTQGIVPCKIMAYTWRYVALLHIVKVVIVQFDRDFISTTLEAHTECDCKMSVRSKQKEGRDVYCAVFEHSSGGGAAHENTEKELPVRKSRVGQDTFQNTTHSVTMTHTQHNH